MTVTEHVVLESLKCWVCGCCFAVDRSIMHNKREYNKTLYCPNGCRLGFGESPSELLRKEYEHKLQTAKDDAEWLRQDRDRKIQRIEEVKKSLSATKGVVTRMKRRVSKGVCPCCNRHFRELERHMKEMHPDFEHEGDE